MPNIWEEPCDGAISSLCGRRDFIALVGGAAAMPLAAPAPAQAQACPSRPITIIVPFGPGSGTDIVTRIIASRWASRSGRAS